MSNNLFPHDTWATMKPGGPYEPILHLFPQGLPLRDPFPMAKGTLPNGETIMLFVIDFLRLDDYQYDAIASLIAQFCEAPLEDVEAEAKEQGGFAVRIEWVEQVCPGLEGLRRIVELVEFKDENPNASSEQWWNFFEEHKRRWIDGKFSEQVSGDDYHSTTEPEHPIGGRCPTHSNDVAYVSNWAFLPDSDKTEVSETIELVSEPEPTIMLITIKRRRVPDYYRPPQGLPLYWRDEISGELQEAVFSYLEGWITNKELELVIEYLQYWVAAPCWQGRVGLSTLKEASKRLQSKKDVDAFLKDCLAIGLDPF